jgi:hypothetical protein
VKDAIPFLMTSTGSEEINSQIIFLDGVCFLSTCFHGALVNFAL